MANWEQTFRMLVATRGTALRSYAYLLTGDASTAGDLVQEALTRVFARRRISADVGELEAYVRRAMLNQYVDGRRRLARWNARRHLLVEPAVHDETSSWSRTRYGVHSQRCRRDSGPASYCATTKT
ncbi:sigma factor [Kribbella sp. NPDC048915]|uniref:sigma factor n=1 Tax=Kribbella sp. NPDC048915 TaxID=3155148 RepID=UPI0033F5278A